MRLLVSISPSVLSVPSEHTPSDIYLYNQIMILVSRITKLSILMKEVRFISLYILEIVHKRGSKTTFILSIEKVADESSNFVCGDYFQ